MGKTKNKTISFTVSPEDYDEILTYARAKGHGGQFPTSTFAHFAVFQAMRKTPLSEAERAKYEKRDGREKQTAPEATATLRSHSTEGSDEK